jgi:hypothetical protein
VFLASLSKVLVDEKLMMFDQENLEPLAALECCAVASTSPKSPHNADYWFKFDDDFVKRVSDEEAVEANYGTTDPPMPASPTTLRLGAPGAPLPRTRLDKRFTNAYMLVYIRDRCVEWMEAATLRPWPCPRTRHYGVGWGWLCFLRYWDDGCGRKGTRLNAPDTPICIVANPIRLEPVHSLKKDAINEAICLPNGCQASPRNRARYSIHQLSVRKKETLL